MRKWASSWTRPTPKLFWLNLGVAGLDAFLAVAAAAHPLTRPYAMVFAVSALPCLLWCAAYKLVFK